MIRNFLNVLYKLKGVEREVSFKELEDEGLSKLKKIYYIH